MNPHLPPPPAWRPGPKLYDMDAEGDDVELADAPPRHVAEGALPPLDASVVDVTQGGDATDAFVVTRQLDAPERVADAPADNLKALLGAWRHAPAGARHASAKLRRPAPLVHPDAWKLDLLRPEYVRHAALYERIQAEQKAELAPLQAQADKRHNDQLIGRIVGAVALGLLALVGVIWFTSLLCLVASVALAAGTYVLGITGLKATQAEEEQARQAASVARQAASPDAWEDALPDAPPARVELTREAVTTALRNAGVIGETVEIRVRPARPMRSNGEPNGWQVHVELPPSVKGGAKKALAARSDIAFAFDKEPNCLLMEPVKGRGLAFTMWVAERDPMACAPVISPLVEAAQSNIHKPVQIGYDVMGRRVFVRCMNEVHGLMTGGTGSGKSSLAAELVANETLYPYGTTIIIDPQRSGRWTAYRDVATVISGSDPDTQRLAAQVLDWVSGAEMDRRALAFEKYLAEHPLASPEDIVTAEMMGIASLRLHHVLVVIDEAHSVLAWPTPFDQHDEKGRTCGKVINDAVQTGVSRSRRVGINYVLVTQRGSVTNIKGDIRSILNGKACFSVQDDESAEMGLGPGWKAAGMDPISLSTSENKGACYLTGEWLAAPAADWVLVKCDHIDVTGHRQIAARGRQLKPQWVLDWAPEPVIRARRGEARAQAAVPVERSAAELLELLRTILEPEGALHAPAIVARLAAEDPDAYLATPATRQGLDALLAPLGLKCERFQRHGVRDHGLKYSSLPAPLPGLCQDPADGSELAEAGQG